jgi:hypothetical protein
VSLDDSPSLLTIVSENISCKHIFVAIYLINSLVLKFCVVEVTSHMSFESTWSHERKTTNRAGERSFTCVTPLVITQMSVCCKWYLTNVTFVWLYTFVNSVVNFKIAAFGKKFPANLALERFNTLVSSNMNFQSTRSWVSFFTVRAFEWQLTRMNQFMCLLVTLSYELFAASLVKTHERAFPGLQNLT